MGTTVAAATERQLTTSDLPVVIRTSVKARNLIAPYLPEGLSLDRVAADLSIALAKDRSAWAQKRAKDRQLPEESPLERCSPMSVFMSCAKAAQLGLVIGETAHLVPFGTECTMVADYKGLVQLVIGSGVVRNVRAHCVYTKEIEKGLFEIELGSGPIIRHRPITNAKERGTIAGAYVVFDLRGTNIPHIKWLAVDEIEAIRQKYSKQWKSGPLEPWYAEKTVIRAGSKTLPKDPRLAKTLAIFEQIDAIELDGIEVPEALRALEAGEQTARVHTIEHREPAPVAEAPAGDAYGDSLPSARDFDDSLPL